MWGVLDGKWWKPWLPPSSDYRLVYVASFGPSALLPLESPPLLFCKERLRKVFQNQLTLSLKDA